MVMKKTPQALYNSQRKQYAKQTSYTPYSQRKSPLDSIENTFYREFPYQMKSPDVKISPALNRTGKLKGLSINKDLVSSVDYERGVFGIDPIRRSLDAGADRAYGAIGVLPLERHMSSFDSSKKQSLTRSASKQSNLSHPRSNDINIPSVLRSRRQGFKHTPSTSTPYFDVMDLAK